MREAIKIPTYLGVLESKRSEGTFACDGSRERMIGPMVYGIILNQDFLEDLMELRQMTEARIMRLAMKKYDDTRISSIKYARSWSAEKCGGQLFPRG